MQLYRQNLSADLEQMYLLGVSDLHVGAPEHNTTYTEKLLRWVVDTPNAFLILNGDLANCAIKNSKSDVYEDTMTPNEQRKYLIKLFMPVKDRVLGVTEGNHEMRIRKETSIDICQDIAEALECPYGREGLLLQIRLGRGKNGKPISYIVYTTHGWSNARTMGGKVNMTTSLSNVVYADAYITGHTHSKFVIDKDYYLPDERNNQVRRCKQVFASSGSVLEYGGYAQAKGYPPGAKGIPRIILDGKRKDIHASI